MPFSAKHAVLLSIALLLCGLLAACGGGSSSGDTLVDGHAPAAAASQPPDLAAITAAPAPEGVDGAVWRGLSWALADALAARAASAAGMPPAGTGGQAQLSYAAASARLEWLYRLPGDYDQNGEVNGSDLVPLARFFGSTSPGGGGAPWPAQAIEAQVDGDGNGEINLADITPIALNWASRVDGYRVYRSADEADWPGGPDGPNGAGAALAGTLTLAQQPAPANQRRAFSFQTVPTATAQWYWVRPYAGAADGSASTLSPAVVIEVPENAAPAARLAQPQPQGTAAHVVWDASASADPDGSVVRYEFDFGADGSYDLAHERVDPDGPGGNPPYWTGGGGPGGTGEPGQGNPALADFWYYAPGQFACRVRVTDNHGAVGVSEVRTVVVTEEQKWRVNVIHRDVMSSGFIPVLFEVNGLPVVELRGQWNVALDELGESWNAPVRPASVNGEPVTNYSVPAIIAGRPMAVVHGGSIPGSPGQAEAVLLRANDAYGLEWPDAAPVLGVDHSSYITGGLLCEIIDKPAFLVNDGCYFAQDAAGSAWGQKLPYQGSVAGFTNPNPNAALRVILGTPVSLRSVSDDLLLTRSIRNGGLVWQEPQVIDGLELVGGLPRPLEVLGHMAVCYHDQGVQALKFRRASGPDAAAWESPIVLSYHAMSWQRPALVDGRPALLYRHRIGGELQYHAANNAAGTRWADPLPLDFGEGISDSPSPASDYASREWFREIGGRPAIAFAEGTDLKLAMYY